MKLGLHQTSIEPQTGGAGYDRDVCCPLCGNQEKKMPVFRVGSFEIVRCTCEMMFLQPMPNAAVLRGIYEKGYYKDPAESYGYYDYSGQAEMIRATYRRRLKFICSLAAKGGNREILKVHEVGPALGFGLQEARALLPKAQISASDVSPEAVAACLSAGFSTYNSDSFGRAPELAPPVDVVYAFDVIEHIAQPRLFVDWLFELLPPGGIAAVTTPDMMHPINRGLGGKSPSIKVPQHVCYYSAATLAKLFGARFTLLGHTWDFQKVSLGFLLSRIFHIVGVRSSVRWQGPGVILPNGMRIFVFRKNHT